jgi:anti-sigma B factor antagonist
MSLTLNERTIGDVVVVDLAGKITLGEGGDAMLKDKVRSLVQQGRRKIVLNLGGVSYVDSAGLGELVQAYATVNKNGGGLKLLNTTKRIKDLLAITKLLTVFECHDSEAAGLKSFGAS